MKTWRWAVLTVAVAAAAACGRSDEPASETTTTSASDEGAGDRAGAEAMNVAPPPAETSEAEEAPPKETAEKKPKAKAKQAAAVKAASVKKAAAVEPEEPRDPWDAPSIVSITAAELTTTPAEAPATPTETPRGAEAPQPAQRMEGAAGHVNQSTTLGNGNSGMYTGGQGTYGGRATWGTGAGAR